MSTLTLSRPEVTVLSNRDLVYEITRHSSLEDLISCVNVSRLFNSVTRNMLLKEIVKAFIDEELDVDEVFDIFSQYGNLTPSFLLTLILPDIKPKQADELLTSYTQEQASWLVQELYDWKAIGSVGSYIYDITDLTVDYRVIGQFLFDMGYYVDGIWIEICIVRVYEDDICELLYSPLAKMITTYVNLMLDTGKSVEEIRNPLTGIDRYIRSLRFSVEYFDEEGNITPREVILAYNDIIDACVVIYPDLEEHRLVLI